MRLRQSGMATETKDFIPTRRSLLNRVKDWNDNTSWQEFFAIYSPLIYAVARKAGMNEAEAEDVVQETILSVARQMCKFQYDPAKGSFKAWLLQVTRCRIIDQIRRRHYKKDGRVMAREEALGTSIAEKEALLADSSFEALWLLEWEKNILKAALHLVKEQVESRQYQMFHLHVVKEVPARDVARRVGAKLAEVYFAKYKVSRLVSREIRRLERQGL